MNELAIDVLQALIHGVILRIKRHQEIGTTRQSNGKEECVRCGWIARIMKSYVSILYDLPKKYVLKTTTFCK